MWFKDDPRWSINKRSRIVIVDLALLKSTLAEVETKHAFCIWTNFSEKDFISADDNWPESWVWSFYPSKEEAKELSKINEVGK